MTIEPFAYVAGDVVIGDDLGVFLILKRGFFGLVPQPAVARRGAAPAIIIIVIIVKR